MKNHPIFNKPAIFLAPLAGLTHSPFRRLLADFGGYSALYSEMLAASSLMHENLQTSTYTNRRESEGKVVYQLQVNNDDPIEKIIERLATEMDPWSLDLNLGCPAPSARRKRTGAALFEDVKEVDQVLTRIRSVWDGTLSVKCRLGSRKSVDWFAHFEHMLSNFEKADINWLTVHARFWEDGRKRLIQSSQYVKIVESTSIPIIGNGEITTAAQLEHPQYECLSGVMIGRMAIVKPWFFKEISDPSFDASAIDYKDLWMTLCEYVEEEFIPTRALGRMKQFTSYYCQNFRFGHSLLSKIVPATSIDEMKGAVEKFFIKKPDLVKSIKILEF